MNDAVFQAAARGLVKRPRRLPPWLFYDTRGSALFEAITRLPEYYLTAAEREIFDRHGDEIVARAGPPLTLVELGAGTAVKTQVLLDAVVRAQGPCRYIPVDLSSTALEACRARLARTLPAVEVLPVLGTHEAALPAIRAGEGTVLVMFIGSSLGNYSDAEAAALLGSVADAMRPGAALLLGTDRPKEPARLLAAYDDPAGVTAEFDLNVLVRLNRELQADFDLTRWRHVARWNEAASRIEMHLVSTAPQQVHIPGLPALDFDRGESIHTESSVKYDLPHVERLLDAAGLTREHGWTDGQGRFDVHLARRA